MIFNDGEPEATTPVVDETPADETPADDNAAPVHHDDETETPATPAA